MAVMLVIATMAVIIITPDMGTIREIIMQEITRIITDTQRFQITQPQTTVDICILMQAVDITILEQPHILLLIILKILQAIYHIQQRIATTFLLILLTDTMALTIIMLVTTIIQLGALDQTQERELHTPLGTTPEPILTLLLQ